MLRLSCSIYCFVLFTSLWCRPKDSLSHYSLKGIDVSFGAVYSRIGERANVNLLKAITPNEIKARYNYDNASSDYKEISPVRIGLGIVFGNNETNSKYFVNKHELMFRFSFETKQSENGYKNIKFALNPGFVDTARFNYTYQTQTIGLGYQLATKSFLKNLAFFGSANADFGMVTFKQIKSLIYNWQSSISDNDLKNYNTTIIRGNVILGVKYNFSCDINFFLQVEFGVLHYGNDIGTDATYVGTSFGIRYKFLEDQDKLKYKNDGFW